MASLRMGEASIEFSDVDFARERYHGAAMLLPQSGGVNARGQRIATVCQVTPWP
jgi:hypothetical protein